MHLLNIAEYDERHLEMRRDRSHLIQWFAALLITFNRTQQAQVKN